MPRMSLISRRFAMKVPLAYLLIGGAWIYGSDLLLELLVTDPLQSTQLQTYKGLVFILTTALLLYLLIRHHLRTLAHSQAGLERVNRALKVLSRFNHGLVQISSEGDLAAELCRTLTEVGGYRLAWIGLQDAIGGGRLRPVAWNGEEAITLAARATAEPLQANDPALQVLVEEAPVVRQMTAAMADEVWCQVMHEAGARALIALPLRLQQTKGALVIYATTTEAFAADEVELLQELAADLCYGLESLRTQSRHLLAEETIRRMAYYDRLTELPNQNYMLDLLAEALPAAHLARTSLALMFIDIDKFSKINRTLGHHLGDRLLAGFATRLAELAPAGATLCRWGSDVFLLLQPQSAGDAEALALAQRLIDGQREPFALQAREIFLSASIGIALFPADGTDIPTLLKNAESALFRAKRLGGGSLMLYAPIMHRRAHERLSLETHLRRALERDEFSLHFQPQIDSRAGTIIGAEVLLRWDHPTLGSISPAKFIPLAEETGLIVQIGAWVLRTACLIAQGWRRDGWPPIRLAVNLSARQFLQQDLLTLVRSELGESGFDPSCLDLEITESAIMEDVDAAVKTLLELKALGVCISIDDFGTGYSSLGYLKRFPIDMLKIDRSFVMGLPSDSDDAAIVQAIVALGQNLKLKVLAEGVETMDQRNFLLTYGCDYFQGFLYSKALPEAEFLGFRRSHAAANPGSAVARPS